MASCYFEGGVTFASGMGCLPSRSSDEENDIVGKDGVSTVQFVG